MRISACIIVKNEEEIVRSCLESVKDFDEIVVVDTGSTDKTKEIASKYTDKIFDLPWNDDFSEARNFAISKCTGDWIFSVDADHEIITPVKKIKDEIKKSNQKVLMVFNGTHWREVLFKNDPEIYWVGKVHEHLSINSDYKADIHRKTGYSDNHKKDPDRNLRILLKSEPSTRRSFYLGREYFEHKQYKESIKWLLEYLKDGKWLPEICEAKLTITKCLWFTNQGELARQWCLCTIGTNPMFREALSLMSTMTYSPRKEKWAKLAESATNEDVLFIRSL